MENFLTFVAVVIDCKMRKIVVPNSHSYILISFHLRLFTPVTHLRMQRTLALTFTKLFTNTRVYFARALYFYYSTFSIFLWFISSYSEKWINKKFFECIHTYEGIVFFTKYRNRLRRSENIYLKNSDCFAINFNQCLRLDEYSGYHTCGLWQKTIAGYSSAAGSLSLLSSNPSLWK